MSRQKSLNLVESAKEFVNAHIAERFHDKLLAGIGALKLRELLARKNPYLFRAKAIQTAPDLIKRLLDAYISSKEETIFGDFMEALAIDVCATAYGGKKSTSEGIDLEFERDGTRYVVSIKSGPNWGNSQQIERMKSNFAKAQRIAGRVKLQAVNGCCYGRDKSPSKGTYLKLCGQPFWELITGKENFYLDIVEPLGHEAKERTDVFEKRYAAVINLFVKEFIDSYCTSDGQIDWSKLVQFNSKN